MSYRELRCFMVMEYQLMRIQQRIASCVTEYDHVKTVSRHEYQLLVEQAREYREGIESLKNLYEVTL